jgi:hypothetical membrane protein
MTARLNRTQVFLASLAAVLVGLFAPGWYGAAVLFVIAAGLAVVLGVTWRRHPPTAVVLRAIVLVGLVLIALRKVG